MMQPVGLFDLASRQAHWLSVRQSAVAGNISNINTPGYRAVDVAPFQEVLENRRLALPPIREGHIPIGTGSRALAARATDSTTASPTGNSVTVEEELVKAGEVRAGLALNTAIVKAFHRMLMSTTRP